MFIDCHVHAVVERRVGDKFYLFNVAHKIPPFDPNLTLYRANGQLTMDNG